MSQFFISSESFMLRQWCSDNYLLLLSNRFTCKYRRLRTIPWLHGVDQQNRLTQRWTVAAWDRNLTDKKNERHSNRLDMVQSSTVSTCRSTLYVPLSLKCDALNIFGTGEVETCVCLFTDPAKLGKFQRRQFNTRPGKKNFFMQPKRFGARTAGTVLLEFDLL